MNKLNKTALEETLATQIAAVTSASPIEDVFSLLDALDIAATDVSVYVDSATDLPDLYTTNIPTGQIVFVKSINTHLIVWGKKWVSVDGRVFRDDSQVTANTIWVWGYNGQGRLGDGTIIDKSSPASIAGGFTDWCQVSAGSGHSLAIRTNGTLWGWGSNGYGRLGDNTTVSKSSPVSVIGGFTDWCQVDGGNKHTAAVRANGTLWTWGYNAQGQLGVGNYSTQVSPTPVLGGFNNWCQVSAGYGSTAAVQTNGTAWTWGTGFWGLLGNGTSTDSTSPVSVVGGFTDWCHVSVGRQHVTGIRTNCTLWSWGSNGYGQLGINAPTTSCNSPVSVVGGFTDWCQVASGFHHTAAVRTNGTMWTWGYNLRGNLGDNSTVSRSSPVSVVGGFTDWCRVTANGYITVGSRVNGTLWAWGGNSSGQLGDGTIVSATSPVSVVGGFTDWCQVSAGGYHVLTIRTT